MRLQSHLREDHQLLPLLHAAQLHQLPDELLLRRQILLLLLILLCLLLLLLLLGHVLLVALQQLLSEV
jgi:hypothetical protein